MKELLMQGRKRASLARHRAATRGGVLWPDWYIVGQQELRRRRMARKRRRGWA